MSPSVRCLRPNNFLQCTRITSMQVSILAILLYNGVAVEATYLRVVAGVVFMVRGTQLIIEEPVTRYNQPVVKGGNSTSILGL
jgi:hypothetical protein